MDSRISIATLLLWIMTSFPLLPYCSCQDACTDTDFVDCVNGTVFYDVERPVPENGNETFDKVYFDRICQEFDAVRACVLGKSTMCNDSASGHLGDRLRTLKPFTFICMDVKDILDKLYPTMAPPVTWTSKYNWEIMRKTSPDDISMPVGVGIAIILAAAIIVGVAYYCYNRQKARKSSDMTKI